MRIKLNKEEKSLRVFDARMEWLFHWRIDSLMREYDSTVRQYYPLDIISLHDKEVYVDCGVYDGGTIMDFVGMSGRKYQWIYGFEAD